MRRKIILIIILIALSLAVALGYSYDFLRLAIIRSTINLPLPGWLQALIWGWG
nr:MAG TPA: Camelysin metallo-endopeptidase [Bacteriophage sp.]